MKDYLHYVSAAANAYMLQHSSAPMLLRQRLLFVVGDG